MKTFLKLAAASVVQGALISGSLVAYYLENWILGVCLNIVGAALGTAILVVVLVLAVKWAQGVARSAKVLLSANAAKARVVASKVVAEVT